MDIHLAPLDADLAASVIIPTWNGARFLPTCLDALARQTLAHYEVIVVDNGSDDETSEVLARYPQLRVIRLPHNVGFAAGVNAGIRIARSAVIALLNNDTEAEPRWLEELVAALSAAPEAGMASSKVLLFDRRDTLHTTGDVLDRSGWPANRGVWERDVGQYDGPTSRWVFSANGAAAAYRQAVFEDVGLFEEAFGSYMEDVDLAWRAQLAGWRCVYAPRSVVFHHLSATGGGALSSYLVARNRIWLIARNYPSRLLLRNLPWVVGAQVRAAWSAVRAWRGEAARATLRGMAVGLVTWPRMLAGRRRIQAGGRIGDGEMAGGMGLR